MNNQYTLWEKLKEIKQVIAEMPMEEFERLSYESGLGKIEDSSESGYVLAVKGYSNKEESFCYNNKFSYYNDDLRGAA